MDRISESRALVPLVPADIVVREPPPTVVVTQPQLPPLPTIIATGASQSTHQLQDIKQQSFSSSTSTVASQGSGGSGSGKPAVIEKLSRPMAFDKVIFIFHI